MRQHSKIQYGLHVRQFPRVHYLEREYRVLDDWMRKFTVLGLTT